MIDIQMDEILSAIKHTEAGEIKFDIDEAHVVHGVIINDQHIKIETIDKNKTDDKIEGSF